MFTYGVYHICEKIQVSNLTSYLKVISSGTTGVNTAKSIPVANDRMYAILITYGNTGGMYISYPVSGSVTAIKELSGTVINVTSAIITIKSDSSRYYRVIEIGRL